ncbi:MAG TPA: GAF domain-containing protein [Candidatus Sulfotelmatobacter sp.]|nr:GAF domain-containing protein [Candidatus Sulfotelmatobacter sp.]
MTILGAKARYSTILEVNRAAITHRCIGEVFHVACSAVNKIMPYKRMGLSLYSPEHGALKLAAANGQGADSIYQPGLILDLTESHHGWVFQHQKRILRRDLHTEYEFRLEQPNIEEGIRSYCAVPLIAQGESVGVMIVLSSLKNRFSKADADFLQEISDQFVLAVRALIPACLEHTHTKLICPRCIASGGGQTTAAKYKEHLSDWGRLGGRGKKKQAGGFGSGI